MKGSEAAIKTGRLTMASSGHLSLSFARKSSLTPGSVIVIASAIKSELSSTVKSALARHPASASIFCVAPRFASVAELMSTQNAQ